MSERDPQIGDDELVEAATRARTLAYAPYSKFDAGAAVRCDNGAVVLGALVENISLGLAMCAERVAMFHAIVAGGRPVELVLAAPPTAGGLTEPCGACLQVALELGGEAMAVTSVGEDGTMRRTTVAELLPRGPRRRQRRQSGPDGTHRPAP